MCVPQCRSPRHNGLADYVATLADFFQDYWSEKDPATKSEIFYKCARYVTVCCWRKMYRRMKHWGSHGFIYELARIDPTTIQSKAKNGTAPKEENQLKDGQ